jgi:hypothetical protein
MAPSAAMAHPCVSDVEASLGKTLTLHSGGNWAGYLPSFTDLEHECAEDLNSYMYRSTTEAAADPVPGVPAGPIVSAAGFQIKNLTPLGHTARNVPFTGTGNGVYNSDLAFKDNYVIAGTYEGFRVLDFTNKSAPVELLNYTGCNVGQGDVIAYGNLVIRSWDAEASASSTCAGQLVGQGFEGIHIFDMSAFYANPATGTPQMIKALRFADNGMTEGPLQNQGCGSHTATAVPDPARGFLYIYNGGSSSNCRGIDIFKISLTNPTNAVVIGRASNQGIDARTGVTRTGNNSCHDNNVLMNVGGGTVGYAMCAGGNGLTMFAFDMAKDPTAAGTKESPGGVENPTQLWTQSMGVSTGHSGSFTYDGKHLIYGHEPGGGSQAQCQASSSTLNKTLFFIDPLTGATTGTMVHPRAQNNRENCTWHNFNVVPTKAGYYATVGSYQSGISILDFTDLTNVKEIAYADPAPLQTNPPTTGIILGGDWSTYWHNGYIYESDIKRGVTSWQLNLGADATAAQANEHLKRINTRALSNPQTQTESFAPENVKPTITVRTPASGQGVKLGSGLTADFDCADDVAVESCVGTVDDGAAVDTASLGNKTFKVTAIDTSGNMTVTEVPFMVNSVDYSFPAGNGNVATVLGLTLGTAPAQFGAFTPGVAQEYLATAAPRITSTAGNATLSVHDPATTFTGRLVNGDRALTNPVQVFSTGGSGATALAGGPVTGAAAPVQVASWAAPVTNGAVNLLFRQNITATEVLRSGSYSKTLTFTLSTTAP